VVDNITVHSTISNTPTENDIAKSIERALERTAGIPTTVKAEVNGHVVRLTGEVEWNFEREDARRAIQRIKGVDYVENLTTLRARPKDASAAKHITAALERNASLFGTDIAVHVTDTTAKLTGSVHTWAQRRTAENIAWSSPYVTHIENQIIVSWF
jgi:osmotically-inducible protein OsmY